MTMAIISKAAAPAPALSEEEIEQAISVADAANALAGHEITDEARDIIRRGLRGEIDDATTVELIAQYARENH